MHIFLVSLRAVSRATVGDMICKIILAAATLSLGSCANFAHDFVNGVPHEVKHLRQNVESIPESKLCFAFYAAIKMNRAELAGRIQQRLISRGILSAEECRLARAGTMRVGMTTDAVFATLGQPLDVNRTVGQGYYSEQWVFGNHSTLESRTYVYMGLDGRVTSFQD